MQLIPDISKMLDILFLALLGCMIGIITGLIPGLHVNTVAVIGFGVYLSLGLNPIQFVVILTAMAITHTFLNFIPTIFLGAPEEDTALSILPAHRLFIQGKSLEAVKLTAIGSLFGLGSALLLLIPAFYLIPLIYSISRGVIAYILIIAVLFLILREKRSRRKFATITFFISGYLGILILGHQKLLSPTEVLFPVFAGLFGLSNIIASLRSRVISVPQDEFIKVGIEPRFLGSGFLGGVGGAIIGVLPALSPSQIGVLICEIVRFDVRNFLIIISAINTSDAIYSLLALFTIHNPRSGVAVIVGKVLEINFDIILFLIGVVALAAFFSTILHIKIGGLMARYVGRINYRNLCIASLLLILSLVFVFTGFFGLCLALLAIAIGLLPILSGVSRTHVMGVLLLPTILYFLGIG